MLYRQKLPRDAKKNYCFNRKSTLGEHSLSQSSLLERNNDLHKSKELRSRNGSAGPQKLELGRLYVSLADAVATPDIEWTRAVSRTLEEACKLTDEGWIYGTDWEPGMTIYKSSDNRMNKPDKHIILGRQRDELWLLWKRK